MTDQRRFSAVPKRRTFVYVQRPVEYGLPGCECGNADPDWSEYRGMLWCASCQKDFVPAHNGVFDGPIPVHCAHLLGLCFDRYNLVTGFIEKWDAPEVAGLLAAAEAH